MNLVCRLFCIFSAVYGGGCSLLLDPTECTSWADCESGQLCSAGVCQGPGGEGGAGGERPDADALYSDKDGGVGPEVDGGQVGPGDPGGPASLRRMTRLEYGTSMKALIGLLGADLLAQEAAFIDEVVESLPPDAVFMGMENNTSRQSSSDLMVEAHWEAAQAIAARLAENMPPLEDFVDCGEPAPKVRVGAAQMTLDAGDLVESQAEFITNGYAFFNYELPEDSVYRFHMRAYGEQLALEGPDVLVEVDGSEVARVDVNSVEPFTYETDFIQLPGGTHQFRFRFVNDDFLEGVGDINFFLQWVEIEGPIDETLSDADSRRRACIEQFVHWVGLRAWRRPLSQSEHDQMMRVYRAGATDGGFHTGIEAVLAGFFFSPSFLYVVEIPHSEEPVEGRLPLSPWSIAGRLAQVIWGSIPDEALLDAVNKGELSTPEQVMAQARRMFDDPRAKARVQDFFKRWLMLFEIPDLTRGDQVYDGNLELLKQDMLGETLSFINEIVLKQGGGYAALMAGRTSFLNTRLGRFYGVTVQGGDSADAFVPTEMPENRLGVLTQASVLALTSKHIQTSPVLRGVFIREQILCNDLPAPPGDIDTMPPDLDPDMTTRERWEAVTTDETGRCYGCHVSIDPVGFLFERYDAVGRYREEELGLPIDDSGFVDQVDGLQEEFNGPIVLAEKLSTHPVALNCAARQWFRYSMGRWENIDDALDMAALELMVGKLEGGQGDLVEMFISLMGTEAFLTMPAPTE